MSRTRRQLVEERPLPDLAGASGLVPVVVGSRPSSCPGRTVVTVTVIVVNVVVPATADRDGCGGASEDAVALVGVPLAPALPGRSRLP
jgi:hypothetical protein